ncbi:OTU domain-containing protein 4 [Protobothrops mucrosquamatus]|uniref:OTU domain-containing protein 4 n=1 Tax=Protobothrops mucrosquamatus TaxID=103944 RepID=UPI0010FAE6A7|nr:OTU domain-containing protein 4 [Protobothrops mucrosquamatus]
MMEEATGSEEEQSRLGNGVGSPAEAAMDGYLRSQGLYRKRVAKDGSCLFRAVAEQVFHSQIQHLDVRMACINYLWKNREKFEAFIEGPFEEHLKHLENPQEWVGQVEISALSLMFKKDFIIYQEPNYTPSYVTENGFPDKILLCFSNSNHYDIVYPIDYKIKAALCQSILYELLYEKVLDVDVNKVLEELSHGDLIKNGRGSTKESDSEGEDPESERAVTSYTNGKKLHKHGKSHNVMSLPGKVLRSLNPLVYQNIEYEVWRQSKIDQQKQDFSIAAGMQYSVGDKCKVYLDHSGRYYNAHIQEVQSADGPVIVFVEELGVKHSVLLRNLKPLPQGTPLETWSTVPGKKIKKTASVQGQNVQTDTDCRGSKNPNKLIKTTSGLPPRMQTTRQHHLPSLGMSSQQSSAHHKTQGRNPLQAVRKTDCETVQELDHPNKNCNAGLSPEEHEEKEAVNEVNSLYEIQFQDKEAFPALLNPPVSQVATQTNETFAWQTPQVPNGRRIGNMKEEQVTKNKDAKDEKVSNLEQILADQKLDPRMSMDTKKDIAAAGILSPSSNGNIHSLPIEQVRDEPLSGINATPSPTVPEIHLPPTVPSVPALLPAWSSESIDYGLTGVPSQIPVSSVMATPTIGLDSTLSQATSNPVAAIPVTLQAVNQPLIPMPQTLNLYQDPLYPGFPINEKGERVITPPYSLCGTGEDLPNDKNILRFFFNLGVKAYSCPMWAPHSYLYPLHQAYLNACRMYPKVPVTMYSHHPWMQDIPLTQNENEQIDGPFHEPNGIRINGQSLQTDTMSSPMPLFIHATQVPESQGLVCVESENPEQALHADYEESLGSKNIFPQPPFGQNPFLGSVPLTSVFPQFWYGYPVPSYIEDSGLRQVVPPEAKRGDTVLSEEETSSVPVAECAEPLQKAKSERNLQGIPLPKTAIKNEYNILNKTSARVPKDQQTCPAILPTTQTKPLLQTPPPTEAQDIRRQTSTSKSEFKNVLGHKEKVKSNAYISVSGEESRRPRAREESSEDEHEVSDMLRSGRSKQFYNQTCGGRRPRSERSYLPGRGGYQYPKNEEPWKGSSTGNRGESSHYHRNFRGRPYRNERRRSNMGNSHRGLQLF